MNKSKRPLHCFFLPVFAVFVSSVFFCTCGCYPIKQICDISRDQRIARKLRPFVAKMSVHEKASQVLMVGIDGNDKFAQHLDAHFADTVPGAVLLFKYNIAASPEGVRSFLQSCSSAFIRLGSKIPVLYAIDHEGGDVYRTGPVTTRLPSAQFVASKMTSGKAELLYESSGRQLAELGIRMNLAPVAETLTAADSKFLGTRSYSSSPAIVAKYATAAVRGYRKAGVCTVLKHFPGNGAGDPHDGLPVLDASRAVLESVYIAPFRKILSESPDAVLVSHIIVSAVEPGVPFCLSHKGVTGLLRNSLGFSGLVITDDIAMSALARNGFGSGKNAVLALKAGCDMIMTSDSDIRSVSSAIAAEANRNPLFMARLDEAVTRILAVKARTGILPDSLGTSTDEGRAARGAQSVTSVAFDEGAYQSARKIADHILEETYDRN